MIALICIQCGGKLSVDESMFIFDSEEEVYIFKKGKQYKCEHCKTEFIQGEEYEPVSNSTINIGSISNISGGVISIGNNNIAVGSGGVVIEGNVKGSIITPRNK